MLALVDETTLKVFTRVFCPPQNVMNEANGIQNIRNKQSMVV